MDPIERQSLIDKYLLGELTGAEVQDFEKEMENDIELASEVELQKLILRGFEKVEEENNRAWLKELDKTIPSPGRQTGKIREIVLVVISLAASVIIAVVMFLRGNGKGEQLFAQNFEPLPAAVEYLSLSRGGESPDTELNTAEYTLAVKAMQVYSQKDYKKAIAAFSSIKELDSKNPELFFYLSLSQLAEGKTQAAIKNLKKLEKISGFKYEEEVKWYLALTYLKTKQTSKGRSLLRQIKNSRGKRDESAGHVLQELQTK